jgi:hypothetical protein
LKIRRYAVWLILALFVSCVLATLSTTSGTPGEAKITGKLNELMQLVDENGAVYNIDRNEIGVKSACRSTPASPKAGRPLASMDGWGSCRRLSYVGFRLRDYTKYREFFSWALVERDDP